MTEVDPTMGDAININIINININIDININININIINIDIDININFCSAMAEVDPTMGDAKESTSRLEDIKYYTRCSLIKILHKVLFHNNQILH